MTLEIKDPWRQSFWTYEKRKLVVCNTIIRKFSSQCNRLLVGCLEYCWVWIFSDKYTVSPKRGNVHTTGFVHTRCALLRDDRASALYSRYSTGFRTLFSNVSCQVKNSTPITIQIRSVAASTSTCLLHQKLSYFHWNDSAKPRSSPPTPSSSRLASASLQATIYNQHEEIGRASCRERV